MAAAMDDIDGVLTVAIREKRFGAVSILNDVAFTLPKAHVVGVVGPSGVGKSTLLRIMAGLERDFIGSVSCASPPCGRERQAMRPVSFMFQNSVLFADRTVRQNIEFPLRILKYDSQHIRTVRDELLEIFQIESIADRTVGNLSGGERQRTALGRCLATPAHVYLLDEPIKAALEPSLREVLREALLQWHSRTKCTMAIVSHEQDDIFSLTSSVVPLFRDRRARRIITEEAYTRPDHLELANFLGPGRIVIGQLGASNLMTREFGPIPVDFDVSEPVPRFAEPLKWLLRPSGLMLEAGSEFRVVQRRFRGSETIWEVVSSQNETAVPDSTLRPTLQISVATKQQFTIGALTGLRIKVSQLLGFDLNGNRVFP